MSTPPARPLYTTPIGTARRPYLTVPDNMFFKNGIYRTDLVIAPGAGTDAFIAHIEALDSHAWQAACAVRSKARVARGRPLYKRDGQTIVVPFRTTGSPANSDPSVPEPVPIFSADGNTIPFRPLIKPGDRLRLSYEALPYNTEVSGAGVLLKLRAVQLIDAPGGGMEGAAFGFRNETV